MIEKVDQKLCIGCGICVEICCMDVFRLRTEVDPIAQDSKGRPLRKTKAYIAYGKDCMTCFNCELKCPTNAITVGFAPPDMPSII